MNNFPKNLMEFEEWFATEEACVEYLRKCKWPEGFRCAVCKGSRSWPLKNRRVEECARCGHQESVTAGTLFHQTRKPLRLWFRAVTLWVTSKRSMSAKEMSRQLDIHYETAWHWCHRLRAVVGAAFGKDRLEFAVDVDATNILGSGESADKGSSLAGRKAWVIGAVEMKGEHMGRVRLEQTPKATAQNIEDFAFRNIKLDRRPSAVGFMIYKRSAFRGLRRHRVVNLKDQAPTAKLFSRIHKVFLLIRRTVLGTFHGSLSRKYLQAYLNEFEFRFNRRNADSRWLLFGRVLEAAPCARGLSLRELVERAGATT
jgi:ISXO2-like transposase domain/Transposase zinc-ribbon domain